MEISISASGKCWRRSRSKDPALCWDLHITEAKVPLNLYLQFSMAGELQQQNAGWTSIPWKLSQGFLLSVVVSPGAAWNSGSAWRGEGTRAAPGATAWTIWRMWGQREQELPLLHSLNNLEHLAHRSASLAVQFPMHCRCQATTLSLPQ